MSKIFSSLKRRLDLDVPAINDIDNICLLLDSIKILISITWDNGYVKDIKLKELSHLDDINLSAHKISLKAVYNFFNQKTPTLLLPFCIYTTEFMKKVYKETLKIPFAQTTSYKRLAETLHTSPRAIGQTMKRNPIPLIIPCHRVVGEKGQLTGFSSGLKIKEKLLNFERGKILNIRIKANIKELR